MRCPWHASTLPKPGNETPVRASEMFKITTLLSDQVVANGPTTHLSGTTQTNNILGRLPNFNQQYKTYTTLVCKTVQPHIISGYSNAPTVKTPPYHLYGDSRTTLWVDDRITTHFSTSLDNLPVLQWRCNHESYKIVHVTHTVFPITLYWCARSHKLLFIVYTNQYHVIFFPTHLFCFVLAIVKYFSGRDLFLDDDIYMIWLSLLLKIFFLFLCILNIIVCLRQRKIFQMTDFQRDTIH